MTIVKVLRIEEWSPLVLIARMKPVDGSTLFQNIWSKRPLTIKLRLVAIDDHEPSPEDVFVFLEQLFFAINLVAVTVMSLLLGIK